MRHFAGATRLSWVGFEADARVGLRWIMRETVLYALSRDENHATYEGRAGGAADESDT